jgi:DNA-binding NarL/FixJ family response regulator
MEYFNNTIDLVCSALALSNVNILTDKSQHQQRVQARRMIWWLLSGQGYSAKEIAEHSHASQSTVLCGIKKVKSDINTFYDFGKLCNTLKEKLKA